MRRTSTCAWRRWPRICIPCVARRRRSCATTRCTAARSASGPEGSARSSSPSGRAGGRLPVRSICERSSSRRSSASKRRSASRGRPSRRGSSSGSSGWGSARSPSARRMRCTSTPITPEPSWRRANAAIAIRARSRIAPSEPSRSAAAICGAQRVELLARRARRASPGSSSRTPSRAAASSTARKKKRSNTSSNTRRSSWLLASVAASASRKSSRSVQLISREHLEGVEQLRGADRHALAAQLLAQLEDPRGQPGAASEADRRSASAGARGLRRHRPASRASARRARRPRPCRCGA